MARNFKKAKEELKSKRVGVPQVAVTEELTTPTIAAQPSQSSKPKKVEEKPARKKEVKEPEDKKLVYFTTRLRPGDRKKIKQYALNNDLFEYEVILLALDKLFK